MIGVPIARLFGIEIRVQLGWIIVLALIAVLAVNELETVEPTLGDAGRWLVAGLVALGFFCSAVIHDLAHALVARRRGVEVPSIAVSFFGGSTPLDPTAPNARDELATAVAGPAASIALAGVLGLIGLAAGSVGNEGFKLVAALMGVLVVLNLILGGVNLVPAYPLDGGRIVRALIWLRKGSERAGWVSAAATGRLAGILAVVVGLAASILGPVTTGAMIALSGWFLFLSARTISDRLRVEALIGGLHVEDAMERTPVTVQPGLTVDTLASQLLDGESAMTAVPVVQADQVVGILGVREVRRLRPNKWATTRVEEVMVKPPRLPVVAVRDTLVVALERLQRAGLDGIPVLDGEALVGVLTRRSVGQMLHERGLVPRGGRSAI
ncbi:MAG TPA: site-2 protease family protein [Candidatus Eisenbacteria bacterium]|nr:site-2 protease family protein [Candidatus Eisenbacteria bacterium]